MEFLRSFLRSHYSHLTEKPVVTSLIVGCLFIVFLLKTMFRHRDCLLSTVATDGKNRRGLELENFEPNFHVYLALMLYRPNTKHYQAFREPGPWLAWNEYCSFLFSAELRNFAQYTS